MNPFHSVRLIAVFALSMGAWDQLFGVQPSGQSPQPGNWRAWLDSPGGELPFGLELRKQGDGWRAWITNGPERIEIPTVSFTDGVLILDIAHYDSKITAKLGTDQSTGVSPGPRLDGEWKKRSSGDAWTRMAFHAVAGGPDRGSRRFPLNKPVASHDGPSSIEGRWAVDFSESEGPAVAVFQGPSDGAVTGTFMTTTGDYRYLAGVFDGTRLRLSCFDGAHAFLFDAGMQADGSLVGDFWSRDSWHETWIARRDDQAELPDAFGLTVWQDHVNLGSLVYPDLSGIRRSLTDPAFAGKARIIEVFGSWCPNCSDATDFLVQLHERYAARGLSIVGLAFELTGDVRRDRRQVKQYVERHGIEYPVLIAGASDKDRASKALPILDRVRAYPTTIFLNSRGAVRAIHTGFSGPATGEVHRALREQFESIIESLLAE